MARRGEIGRRGGAPSFVRAAIAVIEKGTPEHVSQPLRVCKKLVSDDALGEVHALSIGAFARQLGT